MRKFVIAYSIAFASVTFVATNASAAAPASYDGTSKVAARSSTTYEVARRGCGSKGGPGYRKSNGKCASWRD